jgi:hypothetical protein
LETPPSTLQTNVVAVTNGGQGVQSSNLVNIPGQAGQTLTLGGSAATYSKAGSFNAYTVAPNTQEVKIGSFVFQNSNVEDATINNILVNLGGTMTLTNITNLTIKDGSTVVGNPFGTVSASNNFSIPSMVVAKNVSKTFDIYANLGSENGTNVITNSNVTYRGNTSFVNTTSALTTSTTAVNAATQTLVAGNVSKEASSPVSQLAVGNTTSKIVEYKVVAANAPVTIEELTFNVSDMSKVVAIKVGGVTKQVTSTTGNLVTGLAIAVPAGNAGALIPVEVTYGNISTTGGVTSDVSNTSTITLTDVKYKSGSSVATLSGLSLASNGMQAVAS